MIRTGKLIRVNNQRGSVGLEFTLVFPLLLMVVFGIIEFGFLMFDKAIVTNAARDAARAAIVYDYDGPYSTPTCSDVAQLDQAVTEVADRYMRSNLGEGNLFLLKFDAVDPTIVTHPPIIVDATEEYWLPVTVQYEFEFLFLGSIINILFNGSLSPTIRIDAEVKMRGEDQRLFRDFADNFPTLTEWNACIAAG